MQKGVHRIRRAQNQKAAFKLAWGMNGGLIKAAGGLIQSSASVNVHRAPYRTSRPHSWVEQQSLAFGTLKSTGPETERQPQAIRGKPQEKVWCGRTTEHLLINANYLEFCLASNYPALIKNIQYL